MSHFGTTLKTLIESNGLTNDEVAKKAKLDPSIVSRWVNASRMNPSLDNLVRIASVVGNNTEQKAEIIAAHLRDRCYGPGSELIRITISGRKLSSRVPDSESKAIAYLESASAEDPVLSALLVKLAELHERTTNKTANGFSKIKNH